MGRSVRAATDLDEALAEALAHPGPALVHVHADGALV